MNINVLSIDIAEYIANLLPCTIVMEGFVAEIFSDAS